MFKWEQDIFSLSLAHAIAHDLDLAFISLLNVAELLASWASGTMETKGYVPLNQTITTLSCYVALGKPESLWLSLLILINGQTTHIPSLGIIFSQLTLSVAHGESTQHVQFL